MSDKMSDNGTVKENTASAQASELETLDKLAQTKKRYLRPKEIFAYVMANFGHKALNQFMGSHQDFFLVNIMRVKPAHLAFVNTFATAYDAVDDTISGLVIDRTRTRWGRVKPFFILPLPLWIIGGMMLFSTPNLEPESTGLAFYALAAIVIYGLGMSYFNAWNLMFYNVTPNNAERNRLLTTTKFVELFAVWIPSLVSPMLDLLPKMGVPTAKVYAGFSYFMFAFASVFAVYAFFNLRERFPLQSREEMNKISVWTSLKHIFKNKPLFAIILADFFNNFKAVGGSTEQYFWYNNVGAFSYQTICGLFTGIPNYFMIPVASKMVKKFGARATAIFAGLLGLGAYMLLFAAGFPKGAVMKGDFTDHIVINLIVVIVLLTIAGLPNKIIQICNPILTAEAIDYMEWKDGSRNEALVTTVQGYFAKLAITVTKWLSSMVLVWMHYEPQYTADGKLIPNTEDHVQRGIWIVFCILPALARGLYGISFIFYPIHGKLQQKLIVELADKRAALLEENK